MKIGIVVPVLNNFEGFADFILSIKTKHQYVIYLQPQYINQVPLAQAWNKGAQQAFDEGCDYALVCNDDVIFANDCIDQMVSEYQRLKKDKVIMVTPTNIYGQLPNKYDILTYKRPDDEVTIADHPNFSAFLIAPKYFEEIGTFDENYDPAWWEDCDSHQRAMLLGYREICTTAAHMIHIGGVSTSKIPSPDQSKSRAYFLKKWGSLLPTPPQTFTHPYNNPEMSPKDWIKQ